MIDIPDRPHRPLRDLSLADFTWVVQPAFANQLIVKPIDLTKMANSSSTN